MDEPFSAATERERWMAIARRAAARGSRLHLTGFGGDELLYGSVAHLHTLARTNPRVAMHQLRGFAAKYRWPRGRVLRQLSDRSAYSQWLLRVADTLTEPKPPLNEPLLDWGFTPRLPPWATGAAARTVADQIRAQAPTAETLSPARGQHRELETMRFVSRLTRQFGQLAAAVGVAMAAPYYDDRVIEAGLAVRPQERITPWRYKPLIVEAMRGIVPPESLARETKANGSGDEEPGLRRHRADLLALFEDSRLARLGLIDADVLRHLLSGPLPPSLQFGALDQTVACETWLQSLERADRAILGATMTLMLRDGVSSADTDYGTVLLDEDSGQYWNLNPTAALALRTLLDGGSPAEAVRQVTERYSVDAATAGRDVQELVDGLRSASLVERGERAMSMPEALFHQPRLVPLPRRAVAYAAVGAARLFATQPPGRIRAVLGRLHRGATPATFEQAKAARDAVVAVSLHCAAREGCLARSLATVLLCRLSGRWATWCVGARRMPPFGAHAWVEAEGRMVGEDYPPDYFRTFFTVPGRP